MYAYIDLFIENKKKFIYVEVKICEQNEKQKILLEL